MAKAKKKTTKKKTTSKKVTKKKTIAKTEKTPKKESSIFKLSSRALSISLPATGGQTLSLKDFKGKNIVLYFYPKDLTPGCTTEGIDFTSLDKKFKRLNTVILGVSRDSIKLHEKFKEKHQFSFDLLSDEDEKLCNAFDVIKLKKLYSREYLGVERSTFLLDSQGKLVAEWRKVKVKGHAEAVLEAVKLL